MKRNVKLYLITNNPVPRELLGRGNDYHHIKSGKLLWHLHACKLLRKIKPDLFVSPTSFIVPFLSGKKVKFIPVVHDLIAFQPGKHDLKAKIIERFFLKNIAASAIHICTVSESARSELLKKYPFLSKEKVTAIFAGPSGDMASDRISDQRTILCVGTLCPRKNQLGLIKAYNILPQELKNKYELVIAGGRGWSDNEIINMIKKSPGVSWKGYVSSDEYERLMNTCHVLAQPSFYEGFGLQILDALKKGIPILTSNNSALSEIARDCAVYVNPDSAESISKGLEYLLSDVNVINTLARGGQIEAKKYTWRKTADRFMGIAQNLQLHS